MSLREAFRRQSVSCASLGSPFMGRLMALAAERLSPEGPVGESLFAWPGDVSSDGASVPLRLAGALHALVLTGDTALAAVYPPNEAGDDKLWEAVENALETRAETLLAWLDSAPQTNEVRRSAALIAGASWLSARFGKTMRLSELGASGGLNLMFDRFALDLGDRRLGAAAPALTLSPEWRGGPPPVAPLRVAERRGVDLNPIDPRTDNGRLRLRAYLWPDQVHRLDLTDAALSVASAPVDRGDAIDWLAARLHPEPGMLHLVYHTIAWQYFPASAQAHGERLLAEAGRHATPDAPLARLAMEADGAGRGAALTLTVWPDGTQTTLGRIDFHGRWVEWQAPAA